MNKPSHRTTVGALALEKGDLNLRSRHICRLHLQKSLPLRNRCLSLLQRDKSCLIICQIFEKK